jgi:sugar phosphate isomerase/epimerase
MRLALMAKDVGTLISVGEVKSLGFKAVQAFFGSGSDGDADDPAPDDLDALLISADVALAAMTLHVDLVGTRGAVGADVERAIRCVEKTAALDGRFGENESPVLIWHPSAYPEAPDLKDATVVDGLCEALTAVSMAAESLGVRVAVEITRAGSIGGAEAFLRVKDRVGSDALGVCLDAANFTPDRTPLKRAVRMLGPDTFIVHGKDVRFDESGKVADYGPTGTGTLDHADYVDYVQTYTDAPYFVLEYYRSREDLLRARNIVSESLRQG